MSDGVSIIAHGKAFRLIAEVEPNLHEKQMGATGWLMVKDREDNHFIVHRMKSGVFSKPVPVSGPEKNSAPPVRAFPLAFPPGPGY